MSDQLDPHPYALGTEARTTHELFVRDVVIASLERQHAQLLAGLQQVITEMQDYLTHPVVNRMYQDNVTALVARLTALLETP